MHILIFEFWSVKNQKLQISNCRVIYPIMRILINEFWKIRICILGYLTGAVLSNNSKIDILIFKFWSIIITKLLISICSLIFAVWYIPKCIWTIRICIWGYLTSAGLSNIQKCIFRFSSLGPSNIQKLKIKFAVLHCFNTHTKCWFDKPNSIREFKT